MTGRATSPSTAALIAVGAVAGLLSGDLGVGRGITMVPLLTEVLVFDQHRTHAHPLAVIVLIALSGAAVFAFAGKRSRRVARQVVMSGEAERGGQKDGCVRPLRRARVLI